MTKVCLLNSDVARKPFIYTYFRKRIYMFSEFDSFIKSCLKVDDNQLLNSFILINYFFVGTLS